MALFIWIFKIGKTRRILTLAKPARNYMSENSMGKILSFAISVNKKTTVKINVIVFFLITKGQLISKENCQAVNSSKKLTNEFIFTSVFVCFLEEIEDSKMKFRNYLTFSHYSPVLKIYLQSKVIRPKYNKQERL